MQTKDLPIRVTDMRSLALEKARLKNQCKELEDELEARLVHVKSNYGAMAFNSIFPGVGKETHLWRWVGTIAKSAWEKEHFQTILLSALMTILEFIGVRLGVKFFARHFDKKKSSKSTE